MPEITILISEIQDYEKKIAAQQEIIKLQAQLLMKMQEDLPGSRDKGSNDGFI